MDVNEDVSFKKLDSGEPGYILNMFNNQIIAIEFVASFTNESNISNFRAFFKEAWDSDFPNYVEGWDDSDRVVPKEETIKIRKIIYIRPFHAGLDSFKVSSLLRMAENEGDPGWETGKGSSFKIIVNVNEMDKIQYKLPVFIADTSKYSNNIQERTYYPGLSHTVSWRPAAGDDRVSRILQDAYCFFHEDRENLKRAVQGLYKVNPDINQVDTIRTARFDDLENGFKYGYFIKTVYTGEDTTLTFFSDIYYSIQDNTPPETVSKPEVVLDGEDGDVLVNWNPVTDEISNVTEYRIYRATDTGNEVILDTVKSISYIDRIESGATYYYRIKAADRVLNQGDGERSDGIFISLTGWEGTDLDSSSWTYGGHSDSTVHYLHGSQDTLKITLGGWEESVRFMAVRDDTTYFSNAPDDGMRFFDSDWTSPTDSWIFDYAYNEILGDQIDLNFVNNHTYYRRVMRRSISGNVSCDSLGKIVPDCFPPDDIRNLKVESVIDDPNFKRQILGYTKWHFNISWEHADDGASGLKRYHLFRKVEGVNADFIEMDLPDEYCMNFYDDYFVSSGSQISNPVVYYKVTSEDNAGYTRTIEETQWERCDLALGAPEWEFINYEKEDTLISERFALVTLRLNSRSFSTESVDSFVVSINGQERYFPNQDTVMVPLSEDEFSRINVRALYNGKRSSIWSKTKVVSSYNKRPANLQVLSDPAFWKGDINLQWNRPSLDAKAYQVWRRSENNDWHFVSPYVESKDDTIRWTDYYDIDEMTGYQGDTLITYNSYMYKVLMVNYDDEESDFSDSVSTYCDRPPEIVAHELYLTGNSYIKIHWERAKPSLASEVFYTRVKVFRDDMTNVIFDTEENLNHVLEDTTFNLYDEIETGHNYIFQIRETPDYLSGKSSHWSKPYTVSLLNIDSLFIQPQPGGNIFLIWESDVRVFDYPVDTFKVCRILEEDTLCWSLDMTVTSFMDSIKYLEHGKTYTYLVSAIDVMGQVIARGKKHAVCDTGNVFIPSLSSYSPVYFNSDSANIKWYWKDIYGSPLDTLNRGAHLIRIQTSISKNFLTELWKTTTTEGFRAYPADSLNRVKKVKVPDGKSVNNNTVYYRITARDRWGNPEKEIWSDVKMMFFDPIKAVPVENLTVTRTQAFYRGSDTLEVTLQWNDTGIIDSDRFSANIEKYCIFRISDNQEEVGIGELSAQPGSISYSYCTIVPNRDYDYKVITIDSALNTSTSETTRSPFYLPTPLPPDPIDFKECMFQPMQYDSIALNYFIEIAMDPNHFQQAYEMDQISTAHLLSQSGWIDTTHFKDNTGWGSIRTDTTWFRIKVRINPLFESGWSQIIHYTNGGAGIPCFEEIETVVNIPREFKIENNFPNPFNAQTILTYYIPDPGHIEITVYNIRGSMVCRLYSGSKDAGTHSIIWNGMDVYGEITASGLYFVNIIYKTEKGKLFQKKLKMTMIK
jgi:hypothetical protein